jgi:hypothetical protein
MPAQDRKTLKKYFKQGSLPSEDHFKDLIDSMLNMRDEGFEKDHYLGFMVGQLPEGKSITFYKGIPIEKPIWSVKLHLEGDDREDDDLENDDLEDDDRNLYFLNIKDEEILTLTPKGNVGIKQNQPEFDLDVAGNIASRGRIGEKGSKTIHANGSWQDITEPLVGCNAFEIMAGVGKEKSGRYALMHAYALKTFNARGKIVYHQAHYGSRCNRLKLRWKRKPGKQYILQMKTACCYGSGGKRRSQKKGDKAGKDGDIYVKYYLTKLWFDERMKDCLTP